jgi:hypothetical protein
LRGFVGGRSCCPCVWLCWWPAKLATGLTVDDDRCRKPCLPTLPAHEDDARRTVHTGLGIVDAVSILNSRLQAEYGVALTVRLGIHTSKTDGVPLFIEELTKMLLEPMLLREEADHYALTGPLAAVTIPTTLYDALMARLDRVPAVREVAQLGAVLGREFSYELLHALTTIEEARLQHGLTQLVDAELLYQRGRPPRALYLFKHALIQDAAYASLKARRQSATALSLAQHLAHSYTLARMLYYNTLLCQLCRNAQSVRDQADATLTVATAQRLAFMQALEPIMRGRAMAVQEHSTEGLIQNGRARYVPVDRGGGATAPFADHVGGGLWPPGAAGR